MQSLGEQLRRERERAEILEHFCGQDMTQWIVVDEARALDWPWKIGEASGNLAPSPQPRSLDLQ